MKIRMIPVSNAENALEVLDEICELITDEPLRINMGVVLDTLVSEDTLYEKCDNTPRGRPECGAVGCIAGWTMLLSGHYRKEMKNGADTRYAQHLLGLDAAQAQELFWPSDLVSGMCKKQTPEHAVAVVEHIRKFQQKWRVDLENYNFLKV